MWICTLHCQTVVLKGCSNRRLNESIIPVDWNGLLLLQGLLERVVWRHALVHVLVIGDDSVRHGRLLQGGQDVVQVRTAGDLRVLRGLPVGRERWQLLRIGCG